MLRNAPVFDRPNSLIGQHANMVICCHREELTEPVEHSTCFIGHGIDQR
jgi:hypothetical protein